MTPPTATTGKEVASIANPKVSGAVGALVVLSALMIALAYPTLAGMTVAGGTVLAAAFFLGTKV